MSENPDDLERKDGGTPAPERLNAAELRALLVRVRRHGWAFPIVILLGVLSSFAETFGVSLVILYLYTMMGRIHEASAAGGPLGHIFAHVSRWFPDPAALAPLLLAMILLKALIAGGHAMLGGVIQHRLGEDIRNDIHRRFLEVEYPYIRGLEQGEMLNVLATESWAVANTYRALSRILIGGTMILVMIASLLLLSWPLTAVATVGAAVLLVGVNVLARPARGLGRVSADVAEQMAKRTLQTLQGMRAIRAFAQEPAHQALFEEVSSDSRFAAARTEIMYAALTPVSELGYIILLAGIVGLASILRTPFPITLAAVAIVYRLQSPLRELQNTLLSLAEMEAPLHSVAKVLVETEKRSRPAGGICFSGLEHAIRFRDVSFRYEDDGPLALCRANFDIPARRTTAIVGASGAGKTTIVNLLLRLDEPTAGQILVDGTPLFAVDRASWLAQLAVAGQDVELMDSTIRANIQVSRADATDADIRQAARVAGVWDIIEAQPYGLDHWIGPHGANFSGGQRQRLGLARAFLRDPQILVLDEAMNALDAGMDKAIRANLAARFGDRTLVIITHKLETVLQCDHLIYIAGGRVVEQGLPSHLCADRGSSFRALLETAPSSTESDLSLA
ncbi:MAG: ABC transporter ATP-binding protein [Caulobacteraceae bacterium]|nr:ABC transporter ATP-binding protein [Caulobacteraceae bacterium]